MWWKRQPAGVWVELIAATLTLTASPAAAGDAGSGFRRIIPVFGTIVQVDIAGATEAQAAPALDRVESYLRYLDVNWRAFGPGELGRVNAALARREPAEISPLLSRLIARGLELRERSGGLFDPRIGPLVTLWGFQDMAHIAPAAPPADAVIHGTRERAIATARISLDGRWLHSDTAVTLDLAAIAKAGALAGVAALLRANGIDQALLAAGGDLLALGSRGDRPWRAGVRDPLSPEILGTLDLNPGEAVMSSGSYERGFRSGGRSYHHILDPRTGYPSRGSAGATVVHPDAELAAAACVALMVGGPGEFQSLVRSIGVEVALLVTENGEVLSTPGMRARLKPPRANL